MYTCKAKGGKAPGQFLKAGTKKSEYKSPIEDFVGTVLAEVLFAGPPHVKTSISASGNGGKIVLVPSPFE